MASKNNERGIVMTRTTFINLPIKDVNKTKEFFGNLGFEFNTQFSDEKALCMIISEQVKVMLLQESHYSTFTTKEIADAKKSNEVIICLSATSREEVMSLVDKAIAAGGKKSNDMQDHGWMLVGSFEDLDGHLWEIAYMDESAIPQG